LNVLAHNLSRWTVRIGGLDSLPASQPDTPDDPDALENRAHDPLGAPTRKSFVTTDTLRRGYLAIPGRLARSARRLSLHLPARWPRADQFNNMLENIRSVQLVT
jgi:hypothetical protein